MSAAYLRFIVAAPDHLRELAVPDTFGACRAKSHCLFHFRWNIHGSSSYQVPSMQDAADHSRDCGSATVQHHACRAAAHQLMKSHFSQKLASSAGRPVVVVAHKEAMPGEGSRAPVEEPWKISHVQSLQCRYKEAGFFACSHRQSCSDHFRWPPKVHWRCACLGLRMPHTCVRHKA